MIERRTYQRVPFHCRATITPWPAGEPAEAWAVGLSLGGAGLATERVLSARQVVLVAFHLRDAGQNEVEERVLGTIVWARAESEGYAYGVEFGEVLDASQHPLLLRKLDLA